MSKKPRGWTVDTLMVLIDRENMWRDRLDAERDRRYAEVADERGKALKIKEEADKTALGLQRDNQVYKDEKANELREQINSERGLYATKHDLDQMSEKWSATMTPVLDYISRNQGRGAGMAQFYGWIVGGIAVAIAIANFLLTKH